MKVIGRSNEVVDEQKQGLVKNEMGHARLHTYTREGRLIPQPLVISRGVECERASTKSSLCRQIGHKSICR